MTLTGRLLSPAPRRRAVLIGGLLAVGGVRAQQPAASGASWSAAERLVFDDSQLRAVKPPAALHYAFARRGSLDDTLSDQVSIDLRAGPGGACCVAAGRFLSGARALALPPIEDARSNPVILYFLEYDVREMQRRTGGQLAHFRRRIRVALAESAKVSETIVRHGEREWPAREVRFSPYVDDPNRDRFEQLADKEYVFVFAPQLPGGVYQLRTLVANAKGDRASPLIEESVTLTDRPSRP
jgi:hypothetical protein